MAQRGRPRKIQTVEDEVKMTEPVKREAAPKYRHILTYIVKPPSSPDYANGVLTMQDVSNMLSEQHEKYGYVVKGFFHAGDAGADKVGVLYLLEREDV